MKYVLRAFSFTGEASRKEWWLTRMVIIGLIILMAQLDIFIYGEENWGTLSLIFFLFSIWPLLATDIRRWADRGKSPIWILINFVPVIGRLWSVIELGFFPSVKHNPWLGRDY